MIIELQAAKYGLRGFPKEQIPRFVNVVLKRGYMIIPIFVLILGIVKMGFSTSKAGFWAIISCVVISMMRKETMMTPKKIFTAMEKGAKGSLIVAICCASAGIITGTIDFTGIGMRFSNVLLIVAGGNVLLLLFLTMIASLILGLPLPPVTCYLILAVLAAPALVKAGVTPMAAHLFVFFFGVLGSISPPVAPVSFAAAGLAGTDPVKTTNRTFLYSLPSFLVPYLYVYTNELLLMGSPVMIAFRIRDRFCRIELHGRDIPRVPVQVGRLARASPLLDWRLCAGLSRLTSLQASAQCFWHYSWGGKFSRPKPKGRLS